MDFFYYLYAKNFYIAHIIIAVEDKVRNQRPREIAITPFLRKALYSEKTLPAV